MLNEVETLPDLMETINASVQAFLLLIPWLFKRVGLISVIAL